MPTTPEISQITTPNGTTYNLKDAQARADIEAIGQAISGGVSFMGETTTELTDGSTAATIVINGSSVTSIKGYLVVYENKEFIFDGDKWIELGDLSAFGTLAYQDSATGSYTPAGSVTQPTFSGNSLTSTGSYTPAGSVDAPTITVKTAGSTATVTPIATVGTLPSLTATVANENLTLTFSQGTLPTKGSDVTVKTGDAVYEASAPSFSGTQATLSVSGTPSGTVSQPTFSGTAATITVS